MLSRSMHGHGPEPAALGKPHDAKLSSADARGVLQHCLEYWLQLTRRTADDLQDLRGCSLLLQRLGKLARARLHLVEQPRVLNRDHCLVGESGDEVDLILGERLDFGTR